MSKYAWQEKEEVGCVAAVLAVILLIGLCFLGPAIVMWLWNWVAVTLFAAPVITYWQAFGLQWLCGLLFKGTSIVRSKS